MGGEAGLFAGLGEDRGADDLVDRAGRGEEGLARDFRLDGRARRGFRGGALDQLDQVGAALEVVEADVELDDGRAGDDVGRLARRLERGDFEVGGLEGIAAVVEVERLQRGDHLGRLGHRIVGAVRIGDMALHARHRDPHVDRAAPADLDDVAQPILGGRLADQDHVGPDAARRHPVHDRRRAVGGRAFLVAGDDQAERARMIRVARRRRRRRRCRSSCRPRRGRGAGRRESRA